MPEVVCEAPTQPRSTSTTDRCMDQLEALNLNHRSLYGSARGRCTHPTTHCRQQNTLDRRDYFCCVRYINQLQTRTHANKHIGASVLCTNQKSLQIQLLHMSSQIIIFQFYLVIITLSLSLSLTHTHPSLTFSTR